MNDSNVNTAIKEFSFFCLAKGTLDNMINKNGQLFEQKKNQFINSRTQNGLTTNESDIFDLRKEWLKNRINVYQEVVNDSELQQFLNYFLKIEINKYIDYLNKELNKQNSTSAHNNTKTIIKSFESTLTDKQLIKLFTNLKRDRFIHPETDYKQFEAIFRAEAIENIKPIIWLKFKPQLIYMFNELIPTNKVIQPESLYKTLEICFFDKKNKPFKNFKQSNNTQKNITNDIRHAETITAILQKL